MPELPEVETIRRGLEAALSGERIIGFEVLDPRLMNRKESARCAEKLVGQSVSAFHRKGKYLWMELSNAWCLFIHLRMTGQLIIHHAAPTDKPRMQIRFESGQSLGLYDQRRFAEAWMLAPGEPWRSKTPLGPDALTELKREQFVCLVKARSTRIQPLLMDQSCIAGVGNIYAQEALFKAAIRPSRSGKRVTEKEASLLYDTLKETLETAITYRGSSSRNYLDASGKEGSAQTLHAVYQKGGEPCPNCQSTLRAIRVGGRGSVFCPQCQK